MAAFAHVMLGHGFESQGGERELDTGKDSGVIWVVLLKRPKTSLRALIAFLVSFFFFLVCFCACCADPQQRASRNYRCRSRQGARSTVVKGGSV